MKISQSLSNKIANMSFVCACLVVMIHTPFSNGAVDRFVKYWIVGCVALAAVPIFFIISGYFLGQYVNENGWYGQAVKKRIRTLVVPFFVLNLFWWPIQYGIHYIGVRYFGMNGSDPDGSITLYNFFYYTGILPWGGQCLVQLWYVRALFYLIVVSPILVWFIKKGRMATSLLLFVLLVLWCMQVKALPNFGRVVQEKFHFEYCFRCPLYFTIGLLLSQVKPIIQSKGICAVTIPVAILLCAVKKVVPVDMVFVKVVISFFAVISIASALWLMIPSRRWPKALTSNSFALFVLHGMILWLFPIVFKALKIWDKALDIIGGVVYFVIVLFLSIFIAETIKRHFPKIANIAFGGR